jgi:hypothetical protein
VDDTDLIPLFESGCSMVVGLVTDGGEPFAVRAWGAQVTGSAPRRVRVLLPAGSMAAGGFLVGREARRPIGLTASHVATLESIQLKGTAYDFAPATAEEITFAAAQTRRFIDQVIAVDGDAFAHMQRLVPTDYVTCTIDVDELFDQTPGPAAGRRLEEHA